MKRVYLVCLNLRRKKFIITAQFGNILLYKTETRVHKKNNFNFEVRSFERQCKLFIYLLTQKRKALPQH